MRTHRIICTISLLASPVAAQATQLDIKTGQWEMTATVRMKGPIIPPEALARMPPEARASVEAALQTAQQPHTNRICMTEEKLQHGFDLNHRSHGMCHQDVVNLTSTSMEVRGTCTSGQETSTMHAVITAVDRDTIHGTVEVDRTAGHGTVEVDRTAGHGPAHISVTMDGKFLAASCDGTEDKH